MNNTRADDQYIEILRDRITELRGKISKLTNKVNNGIDPFNNAAIKIRGYELEIQELEEEINNRTPRQTLFDGIEVALDALDDRYYDLSDKQDAVQAELDNLRNMRDNLQTVRARRKVDKRIEKLEAKIAKLKNKKVACEKRQKSIMYPKYRKDMIKRGLLARARGRVETYNNLISDNNELKNMLSGNGIFDPIKSVVYDIKGLYYQKRLERSEEVLREMQSKNAIVTMAGARVTSLGKKYADRIRQRFQQQRVQPQPAPSI